jgi:hypothetical protein
MLVILALLPTVITGPLVRVWSRTTSGPVAEATDSEDVPVGVQQPTHPGR